MDEITPLIRDMYFWIGVGLFILSIGAIFWILKSLQAEPEETESEMEILPADEPAVETQTEKASLESLSQRLSSIESELSEIKKLVDHPAGLEKDELHEELQAIAQTIKSNPGGSLDAGQLNQISAKLDKIYKVLVSISGAE